MKPLVIAELPNTGLGNKLFVWAKALVFATLNNADFYCWGWSKISLGPLLRLEKKKRIYFTYFKKAPPSVWLHFRIKKYLSKSATFIQDPPLTTVASPENFKFVFSAIPHWSDYFLGLKDHRQLIRSALLKMLKPELLAIYDKQDVPVFSIHVRLGDFKPLPAGTDFKSVGNTRTPFDYFVKGIRNVRQIIGAPIPVSVFTDGHDHELREILEEANVKIIKGLPDIVDLLLMSKSRILMASASSTFSYWSGFLSDDIVLLHPDHIHQPLRDRETNFLRYEGPLFDSIEQWPDQLVQNLKTLNLK
jgi:hypothetical protein